MARSATRQASSELQRQEIVERLREINGSKGDCLPNEDTQTLIHRVLDSKHALDKRSNMPISHGLDLYKEILETIYSETSDKREAELLIKKIPNGPLT